MMFNDRSARVLRNSLASAACLAGSLLARHAAMAGEIKTVFYIDMENHNLTQPSGATCSSSN